MRILKRKLYCHVCQNCYFSNNEKGEWIKPLITFKKEKKFGVWYIYCEIKKRFYYWYKKKRCFVGKAWVYEHDCISELMNKKRKLLKS